MFSLDSFCLFNLTKKSIKQGSDSELCWVSHKTLCFISFRWFLLLLLLLATEKYPKTNGGWFMDDTNNRTLWNHNYQILTCNQPINSFVVANVYKKATRGEKIDRSKFSPFKLFCDELQNVKGRKRVFEVVIGMRINFLDSSMNLLIK